MSKAHPAHYTILSARSAEDLQQLVSDYMDLPFYGWQPTGGVSVATEQIPTRYGNGSFNRTTFYQAMIRYTKYVDNR